MQTVQTRSFSSSHFFFIGCLRLFVLGVCHFLYFLWIGYEDKKFSTIQLYIFKFRFLEDSHIRHCVPSSVSSGLASLPLNYEYMDQVKTDVKTSKMLPTGEILNGSKSYEMIMSYFTTNSLTPNEVNILGHKRLEKLYPQVRNSLMATIMCFVCLSFSFFQQRKLY